MRGIGIYRHDPQPTQRRRFVPIPAQGDQPPRRTIALSMAVILASWPTGLEHPPRQGRRDVVPLTLTYGNQPPRIRPRFSWYSPESQPQQPRKLIAATIVVAEHPTFTRLPAALLISWNAEPNRAQYRRGIAPLALVYGDQPPPYQPSQIRALIRERWEFPPPRHIRRAQFVPIEAVAAGGPFPHYTRRHLTGGFTEMSGGMS